MHNVLDAANDWYETRRDAHGLINTNTMTCGLIVSGMIRDGLPITEKRLVSDQGSQVRGLGKAAVVKKLREHGEVRTFTSEGGRTSRGSLPLARSFVTVLNEFADLDLDLDRVATQLESYFVRCIQADFFDRQRLDPEIDRFAPVASSVRSILAVAAQRADRPTGTVLQHLVGAKLQLRFPHEQIGVDHANAADQQTRRGGDFEIGDTAFHVTVSPGQAVIEKCAANLASGVRPVLIVPEDKVAAATQLAEIAEVRTRINVVAAETFIGTNIEEIGGYTSQGVETQIAEFLHTYNQRILRIEPDQSLQIEEPRWAIQARMHPAHT